jgi:hypothetical protein
MDIGDRVDLVDTFLAKSFATLNLQILEIKDDRIKVGKNEEGPSIWVWETNLRPRR